jgi:hypothetical protein
MRRLGADARKGGAGDPWTNPKEETVAGRKPVGPALVERVSGSEQAQKRAAVLLETITGDKTMDEACRALGIE